MKRGKYSTFFIVGLVALLAFTMHTPFQFPIIRYFPNFIESPNNPTTQEGVELGRRLFYDPILSADSSLSCASCHKQEFAFSDAGKAFSTGIKQAQQKRNTPGLFNLAWQSHFFWDGKSKTLEEQAFHPVRNADEMGLSWNQAVLRLQQSPDYAKRFKHVFGSTKIDSNQVVMALAQFQRTLISHNSKYDKVLRGEANFTKDEFRGYTLANDQSMADCFQCHLTDGNGLGTDFSMKNNGLDTESALENNADKGLESISGKSTDRGKFKVPSLRNVALTAPYMHDGRFQTLEQVIDFYSDSVHASAYTDSKMTYAYRGGAKLTSTEKKQIIAFLHTLTDSIFISEKNFSNPFANN